MSILTSNGAVVGAESSATGSTETGWQAELRQAVRDARQLCQRLDLPETLAEEATGGAEQFPVFVPPAYLSRIQPGTPDDPLLRQVLPLADETAEQPGFTVDPVADLDATLTAGVLQKYAGRALLVTTGACAVHCRYCFRRHFPYQEIPHSEAAWDAALETIANDNTISEVIFSGGEPLMLVDSRLARLTQRIAKIRHIRRLRIHTRLPIMIPSRVTDELLAWLTSSRLTPVMVLHANHPRELDGQVASATKRLLQAGVTLLNQAVLLRGVNDSVDAQAALSERLIEIGVVPYYLHQLDRVAGASHFEVPLERGVQIHEQLRSSLPGYLVPKYVQEIPGEKSKTDAYQV